MFRTCHLPVQVSSDLNQKWHGWQVRKTCNLSVSPLIEIWANSKISACHLWLRFEQTQKSQRVTFDWDLSKLENLSVSPLIENLSVSPLIEIWRNFNYSQSMSPLIEIWANSKISACHLWLRFAETLIILRACHLWLGFEETLFLSEHVTFVEDMKLLEISVCHLWLRFEET